MAFVYVPNGAIPAAWWPAGEGGADFELSRTLAPLANVRKHLQVISGLEDLSANAGPDGAGDHARAGGTFLTGVRIKKTAGSDIHAGISIDQVDREPDRPPHAFRIAGTHLRRRAQVRRVRFGLRLRVRIQPRLALAEPAARARAQSAVRVRAVVRRRRAEASASRTSSAARPSSIRFSTTCSRMRAA